MISQQLPHCEIFCLDGGVVLLYNEKKETSDTLKHRLSRFVRHNRMVAGISLPACFLTDIRYHYRQALFALEERLSDKHYYDFYPRAIDYIIKNSSPDVLLAASPSGYPPVSPPGFKTAHRAGAHHGSLSEQ